MKLKPKNILFINVINLRDFSVNKHKKVDDKPFGGGPGMVLQYEPIKEALLYKYVKIKSNDGGAPSHLQEMNYVHEYL